MSRRKKWLISLSIAAVVLVSGGWYAKIYVTNRIFDSIESALKDPEIQKTLAELDAKEIEQLIDSVDTDKLISEVGGSEALPSIDIPDLTVSPDTGKAGTDSSQASAAPTTKPSTTSGSKSSTPAATPKPGAASTATPKPGNSASPELEFKNRDSAAKYAMKKFSSGEIVEYMAAYKNKASLSKEEKTKIKQEILSRFNSQEIHALTDAVQ